VGGAEGQLARFIKSQIRGLFLTNPVLEFGQGVHGHWTPASDWPRPLPPIGRGFSSTVEGFLIGPHQVKSWYIRSCNDLRLRSLSKSEPLIGIGCSRPERLSSVAAP
jgi:hypothetical protein